MTEEEKTIIVEPSLKPETIKVEKRRSCAALWLVTFTSLLLALAALAPWFVPALAARLPLPRTMTQHADAQYNDLQQAIGIAKAPPETVAVAAAPSPESEARLQAVQAQVMALNNTVAAQAQRLDAQQDMAGRIRSESVNAALNALQPLLTLQMIDSKIDAGLNYTTDLDRLPMLNDGERTGLGVLAQGGPSRVEIADRAAHQARQLIADLREQSADGWWEKIMARLSGLIYIRTPGTAVDPAEENIDKLVTQIRQGDDQAALAAIAALPQAAQDRLATIRGELEARQKARTALSDATARLSSNNTGAAQ